MEKKSNDCKDFVLQMVFDKTKEQFNGDIGEWTPSQRLWFIQCFEDFCKTPEFEKFMSAFESFVGIYDIEFAEENKAKNLAKSDYDLFCEHKKAINILHVDSFAKLKKYLEKGIVKGLNSDVRVASCYFDVELGENVIEFNSIKIPFSFKDGKLCEGAVIYGWSDMDFKHSHEFLKYELLEAGLLRKRLQDRIEEATLHETTHVKKSFQKELSK